MFIQIQNDGANIVSTNYWQTPHAAAGAFFLSFNAGAARLLVPKQIEQEIEEMRGASEVIISRGLLGGQMALELLWEDGSDSPYSIHMGTNQCDRLLPDSDHGSDIPVSVWTETGKAAEWPGRYRIAQTLPCLQPW